MNQTPKQDRNSLVFDWILVVACALTASVVALLLAFDVNVFVHAPEHQDDQAFVATLRAIHNDVRRRPHDMPVWGSANQEEQLHLKDYVFTDKGSSASLAFNDQSNIDLGENTLIAIEKVQDSSVLNVIKGTLKAKTAPSGAKQILIKVAGQETVIRSEAGAELRLKVEKGKKAELTVLSGKAEVGANHTVVSANQQTSIAENAVVEPPRTLQIRLAEPADGAEWPSDDQAKHQLAWEANGSGPFTVEIARDDGFADIVQATSTSALGMAAPALQDGTYYWRVKGATEVTPERSFTVTQASAPELYAPAVNAEITRTVPAENPKVALDLSWEQLSAAKSYEVQIAQTEDFAQPVQTAQSATAVMTTPQLPGGLYYWRVRVSGGKTWSRTGTFSIHTELEAPPTPAPTPPPTLGAPILPKHIDILLPLLVPRKQPGPLEWLKKLFEDTAYGEDEVPTPNIDWGAVDGAVAYQIEIALDDRFIDVIVKDRVESNSWKVHGLTPGEYYLRVAGIGRSGELGPYSESATLSARKAKKGETKLAVELATPPPIVVPAAPKLRLPVDGEKLSIASLAPVISFQWEPVKGASTYDFQVATDDSFDDIAYEKRTRGQDLNVELKAATYYWRMRSVTIHEQTLLGAWSKPWRFEVIQTEGPTKEVVPKPEPIPPAKPHARPDDGALRLIFAPSYYRYQSLDEDPKLRMHAALFNSVQAAGYVKASETLRPEVDIQRTATTLYRQRHSADPAGQKPIDLSLLSIELGLGIRCAGDADNAFIDLKPGLLFHDVAKFRREGDGTLAADHLRSGGIILGLLAGDRFGETWSGRISADFAGTLGAGAIGDSGAKSSLVLDGGATLVQDLSGWPLALTYGLNAIRSTDHLKGASAKTISVSTDVWTLGLGLEWGF